MRLGIHCTEGEQNSNYKVVRDGTFPMNQPPTRTVLQNAGASKESPIASEECQVPVAVTNAQMIYQLSCNTKQSIQGIPDMTRQFNRTVFAIPKWSLLSDVPCTKYEHKIRGALKTGTNGKHSGKIARFLTCAIDCLWSSKVYAFQSTYLSDRPNPM